MLPDTGTPPGLTAPSHGRTLYFHYAWVIVAMISVVQIVGGSIYAAFGVFIGPMTDTFGWSQGTITLAYALSSLVTALVAPLAGSFGDRYGARRAMALGSVLFVIGMALMGLISEPWHFYLTFGVIMGVAHSIFMVPLLAVTMDWFRRHLGLGMGVLMSAKGIGPVVAAPLIGYLIINYGWRDTCLILAAGSAVILAAMTIWFRNRPADKGVLPYGAMPGDRIDGPKALNRERVDQFGRYMRRTSAYWNMSSIHFLGCVGHAVIIVYLVPLAVFEGVSLVAAAGVLAAMSAVSMVSRLFTPILADTLGTRTIMAVAFLLQGATVIMLFWTHDLWLFYLFAVLFGIGFGGESGGFPILNRRYYGYAPTGSALGAQMLGAGLGMALGGWIGGVIFDIMGNYNVALMVSVAASLGGMVSIIMLEPTSRLLIPDWEEDSPAEMSPTVASEPATAD